MRNSLLWAIALIAITTVPSQASDRADIIATVKAFADASQKGDVTAVISACSSHTIIIDSGAPPYTWQGPNACADYMNAFAINNKATGVTDDVTSIGKPKTVYITGNYAYAMYPATYTDKENGKPTKQAATWTFTLERSPKGWMITGWSWNE